MSGENLQRGLAAVSVAGLWVALGIVDGGPVARAAQAGHDDVQWRVLATAPDTGCIVILRGAEVRRACRGERLDLGTPITVVAVDHGVVRFRVGEAAGMPLELRVGSGEPIDLAAIRRVTESAAPRPVWVGPDQRPPGPREEREP